MFLIFHGNVLIGRSELESGDPPMGVAEGVFEPTDAFAGFRTAMQPVRDGNGKEHEDMQILGGLSAKTADGVLLVCAGVNVVVAGEFENPFERQVTCFGITDPPYDELFPHHRKAYDDWFER